MAKIHSFPAEQTKPTAISFSIWPPTQRTRDAVVKSLVETLSTPSILTKRYSTLSHDEANETAKRIEEEAFAAVGSTPDGDDGGIEVLQVYSKEISKRTLDTVKSRSVTVDDSIVPKEEIESDPSELPDDSVDPSPDSDEISSVKVKSES